MNQNNSEVPLLISLIPKLIRGGHIIPYHVAVSKAASFIKWKHIAVVPSDENVTDLHGIWHSTLSNIDLEEKLHPVQRLLRLGDAGKLALTIAIFLKKEILPYNSYPIIFIENFIHTQLLAFFIALCLVPKKNITVWLLYRQETHKAKTRWIYKLLNKLIQSILGSNKFHLLTDSEVLGKSLRNYFEAEFHVMPIPHTNITKFEFISKQVDEIKSDEIICWWPGAPRSEKGWSVIKSLLSANCESANKICIVAAKDSQLLANPQGVKVKLIDNFLEENEYFRWLQISDIIILPYDAVAYRERTSGIFTECIVAGKIPIVTPDTWMAYELDKYNIHELIFNWNQPNLVIQEIIKISTSLALKEKIKKMQKAYLYFHSIEGYARELKNLFYANGTNRGVL